MKPELLEKVSACALNRIFGNEPVLAARIQSSLGSARAVFELSNPEKADLLGHGSRYLSLINDRELERSSRELETLEEKGCRFICCSDPDYPAGLLQCDDRPAGLYVKSGSSPGDIFGQGPYISIVGTRDMSCYGKEWCERIVRSLACSPQKPTIVSGLAFGVDITAHMAALACSLPTIAVLPTGIDGVYPRQHATAAGKIAAAPGSALVSDFPPGTAPQTFTFLKRNRIIAGIGCVCILIESRRKGGGMITARLAFEYGRDVFCLPGRIGDSRSEGCNLLIGEGIAAPITGLAGLGAALNLDVFNRHRSDELEKEIRRRYTGMQEGKTVDGLVRMAGIVKRRRGICLDELCREMQLDYAQTALLSGILRNDGIIDIDLLQRCTINYKIS